VVRLLPRRSGPRFGSALAAGVEDTCYTTYDGARDPGAWTCGSMAKIRVIFENGAPERVIEFDPAKAPFQHDGRPGSILDVLLAHGIHLEHACGGNCACTTCHVIVKNGFDKLSEAEESELDLLDKAPGLTPTSRLGCQAVIGDEAEITVVIPRFTSNAA
jgi:2Fe-2S ferredoxin